MIVLFFCFFCFRPVCGAGGVQDRNTIPDARMTASTFFNSAYHPYYGRLNEDREYKAWCTKISSGRTDYLQVDMGAVRSVCAVATQGQGYVSSWSTSYKLHLSTDGVTWNAYKETNVEKVNNITYLSIEAEIYRKLIFLCKNQGESDLVLVALT